MDALQQLFQKLQSTRFSIGVTDVIEMLIIAYLIYRILVWVKNTRTWFLIKGVAVLGAFYIIVRVLHFNTLLYIINKALDILLIALIVVFQPELRKALEQLGHGSIFSLFRNSILSDNYGFDSQTVKELVDASYELADARTGALIVIEKNVPLEDYINTGIKVDALLTNQLLINIFEHNTPLHDGAVIVRGNRVAAATCYLPLSSNSNISKAFGTRHRAAVGISEATDSLTIVVSEETGRVSLAEGGVLREDIGREELFKVLSSLYSVEDNSRWKKLKLRRRNKDEEAAS
ncbi:MAG: diadenylate cyclase CdaA [Lachnospiraceae bacterium]|nr:diadenylate cyclase CdaA [Lachnospiraceae bacterium]